MVVKWLVVDGGYPSMLFSRFDTEEECQATCDRINAARKANNEKIDKSPAKGHGAVFANMKNHNVCVCERREFPV